MSFSAAYGCHGCGMERSLSGFVHWMAREITRSMHPGQGMSLATKAVCRRKWHWPERRLGMPIAQLASQMQSRSIRTHDSAWTATDAVYKLCLHCPRLLYCQENV